MIETREVYTGEMRDRYSTSGCSTAAVGWDFFIPTDSRANFILGAFAYSEAALDGYVADALHRSGLKPGEDEFKSGSRMDQECAQTRTRKLLKSHPRSLSHRTCNRSRDVSLGTRQRSPIRAGQDPAYKSIPE
jgi:hypothetical protein